MNNIWVVNGMQFYSGYSFFNTVYNTGIKHIRITRILIFITRNANKLSWYTITYYYLIFLVLVTRDTLNKV